MRAHTLFKSEKDATAERDKYWDSCLLAFRNMYRGTLEVNGRTITLTDEAMVGEGGFKSVYDLGNGQVVALRNFSVDGLSMNNLLDWSQATSHDAELAARLKSLGIVTQDYQRVEAKLNGVLVPVLLSTHFNELNKIGLQVCDGRSGQFSHSMIFGSIDNLKNEEYFRKLFKHFIQDIVILIANKIDLDPDSFDLLVIKNSRLTPSGEDSTRTVIERNQELHFYLSDFFQKQKGFLQETRLRGLNRNGEPNIKEITRIAEYYLRMAHYAISNGVTDAEARQMKLESRIAVYELKELMFEEIKDSLILEIVDRVVADLKFQEVAQCDAVRKPERSLSSCSYFKPRADDEDSEYEYSDDELDNEKELTDSIRRNSM